METKKQKTTEGYNMTRMNEKKALRPGMLVKWKSRRFGIGQGKVLTAYPNCWVVVEDDGGKITFMPPHLVHLRQGK